MKMIYRGVSYEYNPTYVQIAGKQNEVKFRGCSYTMCHAVVNLQHSTNIDLVYRGVSVSEGKEARFLGATYERQQIILAPVMG
jgi:hypothetical protein